MKTISLAILIRSLKKWYYATEVTDPVPLSPDDYFDEIQGLVLANFAGSTAEFERAISILPRPFVSVQQAESAMRLALLKLHDRHTCLHDALETSQIESDNNNPLPVQWKILANIGILTIENFDSLLAVEQTRSALAQLSGVEGYIIDLRGNLGGLTEAAFKIFALLANEGEFMTLKGTVNLALWLTQTEAHTELEGTVTAASREENRTSNKPVVVTLDGESASAAEFLAWALKKHRGARLVGEHTRGKWTYQLIWPLDFGTSLRVTTARQVGKVCGTGLTPDYQMVPADHIVIAKALSAVNRLTAGNDRLGNALTEIIFLEHRLAGNVSRGELSAASAWPQMLRLLDSLPKRMGVTVLQADDLPTLHLWDGQQGSVVTLNLQTFQTEESAFLNLQKISTAHH